MKRVLVLNQFALPRRYAGGTRHVELFGKVPGWEATILAGSRHYFDQRRVESDDVLRTVPVTRYRGNGVGRVINWASYSAGALVRGLVQRNIDVVYGSSPHLGAALAGLIIARLERVPFVLEVRDLWPQILAESGTLDENGKVYRALKRLELMLYRSADRIVVLAEGSERAIVAQGFDAAKLIFIPNGADPEDFTVDVPRDELRRRYGFTGYTAVYAGAHGPANGLDLLVDTAAELERSGADVDVVLIGDGVAKEALRSRATRSGVMSVRFLDPIPKSELPEFLAAADVGVHCLADVELFRSAVSPNKLYDYMAAGLPVITNTGGDVGDLVRASDAGLAVSPDGLADGLRTMSGWSPEANASASVHGRGFVSANYSRAAMAGRLTELLDSLTSEQ